MTSGSFYPTHEQLGILSFLTVTLLASPPVLDISSSNLWLFQSSLTAFLIIWHVLTLFMYSCIHVHHLLHAEMMTSICSSSCPQKSSLNQYFQHYLQWLNSLSLLRYCQSGLVWTYRSDWVDASENNTSLSATFCMWSTYLLYFTFLSVLFILCK